jgi:uncharacterized protein YbjQ (UPF0145 family)
MTRPARPQPRRRNHDHDHDADHRGQAHRDYKGVVTGEAILGANGSMLMMSVSGTAVVI